MRIAIYPGSFDPATLGHLDIIARAAKLFDKVIVAILVNAEKKPLFSIEEKRAMLKNMTSECENVEIDSFHGLLAEYAKQKNATAIIKGLRAVSDFEYEFQMALANRRLNPNIDTTFLMTSEKYMFLSSSIVKDIARYGGDISTLVHPSVLGDIENKFKGDL